MDNELLQEASKEADKGAPDPSTIDLAPNGSLVVPPAALRLLQSVNRAEELAEEDSSFFILWVATEGQKGKTARKRLWKLSRDPKKLLAAFMDWQWESDATELAAQMNELAPELKEFEQNGEMLDPDGDEGDGSEGNGSGSRKS